MRTSGNGIQDCSSSSGVRPKVEATGPGWSENLFYLETSPQLAPAGGSETRTQGKGKGQSWEGAGPGLHQMRPGDQSSSFLCFLKGETDMMMVCDGTDSGFNGCLFKMVGVDSSVELVMEAAVIGV